MPGSRLIITNLQLQPDTEHLAKLRRDYSLPPLLYNVLIPRMTVEGISWARLASDKILACDVIRIENPVIRITRISKEKPDKKDEKREPPKFQSILAKQVMVQNPDIMFADSTGKAPVSFVAKGGGILMSEWEFDLKKPVDSGNLFYARHTQMRFASFNIRNPDMLYAVGSGGVEFDNGDNHFAVTDLRIKPALSREEFYHRTGYQKEIYDVSFPAFRLDGFEWRKLIYGGVLTARSGTLRKASVNIYMSRVPPPNPYSKNGKFPHELLVKLKVPVNIPRQNIEDGRFAYTEKNQKTMQEGAVAMSAINGGIQNITNMPDIIRRNKVCSIHMDGSFKGSPIQATFRFMLGTNDGAFSVNGGMGAMDGTKMNDIVRSLALAEFRSLNINKIVFHIDGSERSAKGSLTMLYDDLKMNLLKADDGDLEKAGLTSLLANHLLTFSENTASGKGPRTAHPEVTRDDTKSFFNLIWKNIFTGMLQTASRKLIKLDKVVNNRIEKQGEKRLENGPPKPGGKVKRKR